jgi:hypothetical protein
VLSSSEGMLAQCSGKGRLRTGRQTPHRSPEPGPRAGLRELEPAAAGPRLLEQPAVESSKKREVTVKVVSVRLGMMKRTQSTDDCAKMKSVANE